MKKIRLIFHSKVFLWTHLSVCEKRSRISVAAEKRNILTKKAKRLESFVKFWETLSENKRKCSIILVLGTCRGVCRYRKWRWPCRSIRPWQPSAITRLKRREFKWQPAQPHSTSTNTNTNISINNSNTHSHIIIRPTKLIRYIQLQQHFTNSYRYCDIHFWLFTKKTKTFGPFFLSRQIWSCDWNMSNFWHETKNHNPCLIENTNSSYRYSFCWQ